jgi:peptidoglycan/LPS O-acetylase OafA/YrhL
MGSITNRPEVDGLRAFAVIPVILFHMDFPWIAGGYLGVDVFFVISGFLITSILVKDIAADSFSFREFWGRRIRRILPALLVVTLATLGCTYLFGFRPDNPAIGRQARAALLSFANMYFWRRTGDYWGPAADESPFLHTWSLSVEEQFYLAFPVVLFVVMRKWPQRLHGLMLAVVVLSLSLFLWASTAYPNAAFYSLPTRAWELATGGYLAVLFRDNRFQHAVGSSCPGLAVAGLAMIVASNLFVPTLNGGVAIAVLGSALVIAFGQTGMCFRLLSQPHIVLIGRMSYSLYLWHWPVLVFARQFGWNGPKLLLMIPIFVLSVASYYLVETPTRRRPGIVPAIAGCYSVVLGLSAMLATSSPYYDDSQFEPHHWYGRYYDLKPGNELSPDFQKVIATMDVPAREAARDAYRHGGIIVGGPEDASPRIVVLGDSHGVMWSDAVHSVTEERGIKTSFLSMNGVPPYIHLPLSRDQQVPFISAEEKYDYDKSRLELIEAWKPDLAIICCRWAIVSEADLRDLLDFLEQHVGRILLMEQPPELADIGNRNVQQYLIYRGIEPETGVRQYLAAGNSEKVQAGRELVKTLARTRPRVGVIPTYDLYARDSEALVLDGKHVVYVDDDHLSTYGARLAHDRIEQALSEEMDQSTTHVQGGRLIETPAGGNTP